jgi:hypothetical protein
VKLQKFAMRIVISRYAISRHSSEPSISEDSVAEDPEESGFGESGFSKVRNSCTLKSRDAISRRRVVWATVKVSGGQVA